MVQVLDPEWGTVNLYVFPDGVDDEGGVRTSVPYRPEGNADIGWHWITREEA